MDSVKYLIALQGHMQEGEVQDMIFQWLINVLLS